MSLPSYVTIIWAGLASQRKAMRITKVDAAERMGKDWSTVNRWEAVGIPDIVLMRDYAVKVLGMALTLDLTPGKERGILVPLTQPGAVEIGGSETTTEGAE